MVKFLAICPVLPTFKNPDLTSKNPVFMRVTGIAGKCEKAEKRVGN